MEGWTDEDHQTWGLLRNSIRVGQLSTVDLTVRGPDMCTIDYPDTDLFQTAAITDTRIQVWISTIPGMKYLVIVNSTSTQSTLRYDEADEDGVRAAIETILLRHPPQTLSPTALRPTPATPATVRRPPAPSDPTRNPLTPGALVFTRPPGPRPP